MTGTVTHSQIETLEGRIAPAGLITVTFNNGALVLTSDNGTHDFSISALDATTVRLLGTDGTLFHMEGQTDSDTLLLTTPIKSLSATLGSDADHMTVAGLNAAGDIAIDLGEGLNELTLDSITTKRGIEISGGDGGDNIEIQGALTSAKKDLVVDLGNGENVFSTESGLLDVGGSLLYTGGTGIDDISVVGTLKVKGSAEFTLGAGTNTFGSQPVLVSSLLVGKDLVFDSSASTSAVGDETTIGFGGFSLSVKGAVQVVDGAGKLNVNPAFGPGLIAKIGSANIVTGGGVATISFTSSALSAKSILIDASESESSTATIGSFASSFSSNLTYIGGAGNDTVAMQLISGISAKGSSNLKIDLGDGMNSVQALSFANFFKNVSVTGGTGTDVVSISAVGAAINNIVIDNGDGVANTQVQLADTKVAGQIKVTNGAGGESESGSLALAFLNAQIGGVSYTSDLAANLVTFGPGLGFASSGFIIKNSIEVTTGDGDDQVNFGNVVNSKIGKGINLSLGDGLNQVTGFFGNLTTKALTITGGSGSDSVLLIGAGNLGAVNLSLGAGLNTAAFSGQTVPLGLSSLTYTSESDGMQADLLTLSRVQVSGKLDATLGAAASNVKIDDSIIGGPFSVDTGDGGDFVLIDTDDSNASTMLSKAVLILLGEGNDTLKLGGTNAVSSVVNAKSTFRADGGPGTNILTDSPDNIFAKDPVFEGFAIN